MPNLCAWLAAGLLATSGAVQSADAPVSFYNLSNDPNSLQLLGLTSIDGTRARRTAIVVDLFRGRQRFGVINTYSFDCVRGRMSIIESMMFEPGHSGPRKSVKSKVIATNSSPQSQLMATLVCDGRGVLDRRRSYYEDDISPIIARFWGL